MQSSSTQRLPPAWSPRGHLGCLGCFDIFDGITFITPAADARTAALGKAEVHNKVEGEAPEVRQHTMQMSAQSEVVAADESASGACPAEVLGDGLSLDLVDASAVGEELGRQQVLAEHVVQEEVQANLA